MKKFDWKSKLTSRKFWAAVVSFVTMLVVALGGSDALAAQITGLIMAGASVVAYIIGEGLADAANARKADSATANNAEQKEGDGKTTNKTPDAPSETASSDVEKSEQNSV